MLSRSANAVSREELLRIIRGGRGTEAVLVDASDIGWELTLKRAVERATRRDGEVRILVLRTE